jgi:ribosome-associated protein
MKMDLDAALDIYVQAIVGKKAESVVVMDLRGLSSIADAFIICSARSNRQASAIAEHVQRFLLKQHGIKPLSVDGKSEGLWVLMDYGHVIIHIFYEVTRRFYDLEGLWIDARRITTKSMLSQPPDSHELLDGDETIVE